MKEIELTIKIYEEQYEHIKSMTMDKIKDYHALLYDICERIKNGTPLPKECDIQRIIPKRMNVQKWIYTKCPNPNCDYELSKHHDDGYYSIEHKPNFCPDCGQALLWEIEE